jgi:hypothetical protein
VSAYGTGLHNKLLHLADARRAFESGDVVAALTEVDAAIALDSHFVAARALREEIVAHSTQPRLPQRANAVAKTGRRPVIAIIAAALMLSLAGVTEVAYQRGRFYSRRGAPPAVVPAAAGDVAVPSAPPVRSLAAATPVEQSTVTGVEWTSPRLTRLHARPQWRAAAINVPDALLLRDLREGVAQVWTDTIPDPVDVLFVGGAPDQMQWASWRDALKAKGMVWRIASQDAAIEDDVTAAAVAAGFVRGARVGYARGYIAEQYTLNQRAR